MVSLLAAQLAMEDGPEDVMVTFRNHFSRHPPCQTRSVSQILLLVVLDRQRTNLAMARREIRDFCASFAS